MDHRGAAFVDERVRGDVVRGGGRQGGRNEEVPVKVVGVLFGSRGGDRCGVKLCVRVHDDAVRPPVYGNLWQWRGLRPPNSG